MLRGIGFRVLGLSVLVLEVVLLHGFLCKHPVSVASAWLKLSPCYRVILNLGSVFGSWVGETISIRGNRIQAS